ncbi:MAG TPA: TRAM domain-containing protein [Candidatus Saccharimonadales bacterium]|nr:TRAM domain-containing protein [Candidatus Saccharimonadales bacterium]
MEEVTVTKLVHGGQGLAELADGRKVFVWNALPGETVRVRIIKKKRSFAEAIAEEVVVASPDRVPPREENYLATSPWQMMTFAAENRYKAEIVRELFAHEKVTLPGGSVIPTGAKRNGGIPSDTTQAGSLRSGYASGRDDSVVHDEREWNYRNKMEYSFWGDEQGLHLALHRRASHGKQIVQGSELAMPAVDAGANSVLAELQKLDIRAGDLKTIIVRCSQARHPGLDPGSSRKSSAEGTNYLLDSRLRGNDRSESVSPETVAALFVKREDFPQVELPEGVKGLRVYYSNPKSPASVPTRLLYELGDVGLEDTLLGKPFHYDVDSFFQVNLPIYEQALARIREHCSADPVDMYAGVGSIGLSVAKQKVELVELDPATAAMARVNAEASGLQVGVVEASTERALESITGDQPVIFDPPRAGLHDKVVERCLEVLPPQIIYLSCNPATQARDLKLLAENYTIDFFEIYNFFPRTPHIETLAVLTSKA